MHKIIRKMKIEDLPAIMKIEEKLFTTAWEREMFLEEINKQYAFVLEIDDNIAGYICGWKLVDECNITNIGINRQHQRKGYGEELVVLLMKKLTSEDCFKFFLEVRASNHAAQQLYNKLGFSLIGTRKKYYHTPFEDAYIYGIDLMKQDLI